MKEQTIFTQEETNLICIANDWVNKNKDYLKYCNFTKKDLIRIGKNILELQIVDL